MIALSAWPAIAGAETFQGTDLGCFLCFVARRVLVQSRQQSRLEMAGDLHIPEIADRILVHLANLDLWLGRSEADPTSDADIIEDLKQPIQFDVRDGQ